MAQLLLLFCQQALQSLDSEKTLTPNILGNLRIDDGGATAAPLRCSASMAEMGMTCCLGSSPLRRSAGIQTGERAAAKDAVEGLLTVLIVGAKRSTPDKEKIEAEEGTGRLSCLHLYHSGIQGEILITMLWVHFTNKAFYLFGLLASLFGGIQAACSICIEVRLRERPLHLCMVALRTSNTW